MTPKKPKLGQNFLIDDRARQAIAASLGDTSNRTVLEIGPGHGAITDLIAPRCRRLLLVELDRALAAELRFRFRAAPHVEVVEADILSVDLATILPAGETTDVIGNLPYYITSSILLKLFAAANAGLLARAVLMMQREVAERVAAAPGIRDYGLLSATAQMYAHIENLFTLAPEAFAPPPDVHSTVIRLDFAPRFVELQVEPAPFDTFLRQIFSQKRKTLRNNLRASGYTAEHINAHWPPTIPPEARAEALSLEQTATLFRAVGEILIRAASEW